jgi:hypothetical protein
MLRRALPFCTTSPLRRPSGRASAEKAGPCRGESIAKKRQISQKVETTPRGVQQGGVPLPATRSTRARHLSGERIKYRTTRSILQGIWASGVRGDREVDAADQRLSALSRLF